VTVVIQKTQTQCEFCGHYTTDVLYAHIICNDCKRDLLVEYFELIWKYIEGFRGSPFLTFESFIKQKLSKGARNE